MPLPLYLAMTPTEISSAPSLPPHIAWMACHFSPGGTGLIDTPAGLPEGALLILDDSIPCDGHSAPLVADSLRAVVTRFHCSGVLLDFQRPGNAQAAAIAAKLVNTLPCPVGVTPEYAVFLPCPVFLPPAPLHMPMSRYLRPWKSREIWLEAALCRELVTVTKRGTSFAGADSQDDYGAGFYDELLCCRYLTAIGKERITFTLFDTPETLEKKLELAAATGVTRAIGLYQEFGNCIFT